MSKKHYVINLKEAEEFGDYIVSILNIINLQVERNHEKVYLWEIRHPKLLNYQLGALELGGVKNNIEYFNAAMYIEIRFDIGHLRTLNKYEFVDKVDKNEMDYRNDKPKFLRFHFKEIDYEGVNQILKELNYAFWIDGSNS